MRAAHTVLLTLFLVFLALAANALPRGYFASVSSTGPISASALTVSGSGVVISATGTNQIASITTLDAKQISATAATIGTVTGSGSGLTNIPLGTAVTGNLDVSHLNSGTGASGSTAWFGDGTWKSLSSDIVLISSSTATGVNQINFDSSLITSTYATYKISFRGCNSSGTVTTFEVNLSTNNGTGFFSSSDYTGQSLFANGSTATAATTSANSLLAASLNATYGDLTFYNLPLATGKGIVGEMRQMATSNNTIRQYAFNVANSGVVNYLRLNITGGGNFSGCAYSLFGIKG